MIENRSDSFRRFPFKDEQGSMEAIDWVVSMSPLLFENEPAVLYEIAYGYHDYGEAGGIILNLGTCGGGSACCLALGARAGGKQLPVMTVDHYDKEADSDALFGFLRNLIYSRDLNRCICPVMYDSVPFLKIYPVPARIVFIDTNHIYGHTKLEIELAMRLIVKDGWLVFHDYVDGHPGVIQAVNEFIDNSEYYQLYDLEVYFEPPSLVAIHLNC